MTPSKEIGCVATIHTELLAPQPRRMSDLLIPATQSPSFSHLALLAINVHKNTAPLIYEHDAYDDDSPTSPLSNDYHDSPISPLSDDQSLSYSESPSPVDSPRTLSDWLTEVTKAGYQPPTPPQNSPPLSPQFSPHSNLSSPAVSLCKEPLRITIKSALPCLVQAEYTKRPPHMGLPPLSPFMAYLDIVARTLTHTLLPRTQPNSSLPLTCIRVFIENKAPVTISNEKFEDQSNLTIEVYADKTCKTDSR